MGIRLDCVTKIMEAREPLLQTSAIGIGSMARTPTPRRSRNDSPGSEGTTLNKPSTAIMLFMTRGVGKDSRFGQIPLMNFFCD
jgi:hypothetical protein